MPQEPKRRGSLQHPQSLQRLLGLLLPAQMFQCIVKFAPHVIRLAIQQGLEECAPLEERAEPPTTHRQRLPGVVLQCRTLLAGEERPLMLRKCSIAWLVGERFDPSTRQSEDFVRRTAAEPLVP